jgi:hypothetical protein
MYVPHHQCPDGTYQMVIFDDPLDYTIAFHTSSSATARS